MVVLGGIVNKAILFSLAILRVFGCKWALALSNMSKHLALRLLINGAKQKSIHCTNMALLIKPLSDEVYCHSDGRPSDATHGTLFLKMTIGGIWSPVDVIPCTVVMWSNVIPAIDVALMQVLLTMT